MEFLYDIVSPYAMLAWRVLGTYRSQWPTLQFVPVPVFLGGIMKGAGNKVREGLQPCHERRPSCDLNICKIVPWLCCCCG